MEIGDLEVFGIIYKIRNKINNKLYIGQTCQKRGFKDRYCAKGTGIERVYNFCIRQKKYNEDYNVHLFNAMEKYGLENFEVSEIFDIAFSKDELNIKEQCWIQIYKSTSRKYGYNIQTGGENNKHSETSKTRTGVGIICIDDNKIYKSLQEASREYDVSAHYIKQTFKKKHSYNNFKNESPIFRKPKRELKEKEGMCHICGTYIKKNTNNKKYCKKCADEVNKNRRNKNIDTSKIYDKKTYGKRTKYKYNKYIKWFILDCFKETEDISIIINKVEKAHKTSVEYKYIEELLSQLKLLRANKKLKYDNYGIPKIFIQ